MEVDIKVVAVILLVFRVEGPLVDLGWKRITDKNNENFKIKWVECKNTINYGAFKEGQYAVRFLFFIS